MQHKTNFRTAVNCIFLAGLLVSGAILLLGVSACNKQALAPAAGTPKASTSLTVGGPPQIIAWLRGQDIPVEADLVSTFAGRVSPFSFAIGGKGYMGAGINFTNNPAKIEVPGTDVWQYDAATLAWTQVANWPGAAHTGMASFVIGNSGYVCTGSTVPDFSNPNSRVKEVWQYDQNANEWTRKNNFPGAARQCAVAASINGKGYLGTGTTASNDGTRDWWQYNPSTDEWVEKANLPGPKRTEAVAFAPSSGNGKVYVATGFAELLPPSGTGFNDLWEYNPASDGWAQKASLPAIGRANAVGISLSTTGVVSTGLYQECDNCALNDCWQFNPSTGAWFQLPNVGGGPRFTAGSFCIGNTIYIGAGQVPSSANISATDFWGLNLN
jgi:hypothetical protein